MHVRPVLLGALALLAAPLLAPPPASADAAIRVSPATGLDPAGAFVVVSGTGYQPNAQLFVMQCRATSGEDHTCNSVGLRKVTTDAAGSFTANAMRLVARFGATDCTTTPCAVKTSAVADHVDDRSQDRSAAISFRAAPPTTTAPPATVAPTAPPTTAAPVVTAPPTTAPPATAATPGDTTTTATPAEATTTTGEVAGGDDDDRTVAAERDAADGGTDRTEPGEPTHEATEEAAADAAAAGPGGADGGDGGDGTGTAAVAVGALAVLVATGAAAAVLIRRRRAATPA